MTDYHDVHQDAARIAAIRALNDTFRKTLKGGKVILIAGIMALEETTRLRVLIAVQDFDEFNLENDPFQEHDFGALDAEGERIFFKIDYFDLACEFHSDDPADPSKTVRIITIMLASEY